MSLDYKQTYQDIYFCDSIRYILDGMVNGVHKRFVSKLPVTFFLFLYVYRALSTT
jgi:hypothetical protein